MREGPDIARLAALIGDPARAQILTALMDGQALTASELAEVAGITLPTASGHLAKLTEADLLQRRKQGRHRYFQLADADVAAALEALMGLAAGRGIKPVRPGPKDAAMREARVCYNHLAGRMGVQMFQSLVQRDYLLERGEDLKLTPQGSDFMADIGVDLAALEAGRAVLCRSCLDWSERRSHLAGSLGRALLARFETLGWMARDEGSRAIRVSQKGRVAFDGHFPV
ncbi:ArsR/SmtB family transcription factor [Aestuariivita boseongensis]|uniref:ArsR/SmtB family transcription factor n=1 Tax=Aestuariivita boseongensis TaxID=1470562 RepID=UPI00068303A5|nr:winged helix-turn-helix domain-containing protein [Aestuariivita boseongensis]